MSCRLFFTSFGLPFPLSQFLILFPREPRFSLSLNPMYTWTLENVWAGLTLKFRWKKAFPENVSFFSLFSHCICAYFLIIKDESSVNRFVSWLIIYVTCDNHLTFFLNFLIWIQGTKSMLSLPHISIMRIRSYNLMLL